jgi:GT2 family glycosyltransferase
MENITIPKVFIIVLNYNGKNCLSQCLNSVYQSDYPNFEVIVVDNASTDGSFEEARQKFQSANLIRNNANLGFAAGNNIGIRYALEKFGDYVFLLNNDATLESETLSELVAQAEKNRLSIASPLIYKNDKIWFEGGKIIWLMMRAIHKKLRTSLTKPFVSEYVTGCAMLINKKVFQTIGLFDEKFFLYYEDADFCTRAKRKGFSSYIIPSAKVTHKEASESENPAKLYWLVLSGLIFFQKNTPLIFRPCQQIYLAVRKFKNKSKLKNKNDLSAIQVKKAYADFSKHISK